MTSSDHNPAGPGTPLPDDQQLSAWLDSGLDEEGSMNMADLAARNEDVAARVARLRQMDELIRAAVPQEDEIPAELLARLGLAPAAAAGPAEVIDLAAARAARSAAAPARQPLRFAGFGRIAAQLVLVLGLGLGAMLALCPNRAGQAPAGPAAASPGQADYRVLGDAGPAAPAANALVRFAPGVDAAAAEALSRNAGATLIGPPSASGTARLAIDPARRDAVLARLRETTGVVLAEPLDSGAQP